MRWGRAGVALAAVLGAGAGFTAGAWWYALTQLEAPAGPRVAPIVFAPPSALTAAPIAAPARPPAETDAGIAAEPGPAACAELQRVLVITSGELAGARAQALKREEQRMVLEGTPVRFDGGAQPVRYAPEALREAILGAIGQAGVPARVQGLDCSEWPCIVFGRIRGPEDSMARIEGARALAAYEGDILTVLLWAATDEAATESPVPGLPGRPEQSLFALAYYPRGLDRATADNLDRRLRSRTAALWNTISPSDVTGR